MRIEEDIKAMRFNIYVDTDSEYKVMKTMMATPSPDLKTMAKLHLNSLYGKAVTIMDKNYIVVHTNNGQVAIIFKDKITGIFKHEDGTSDILLESGSMFNLKDKYEDIIKQLI